MCGNPDYSWQLLKLLLTQIPWLLPIWCQNPWFSPDFPDLRATLLKIVWDWKCFSKSRRKLISKRKRLKILKINILLILKVGGFFYLRVRKKDRAVNGRIVVVVSTLNIGKCNQDEVLWCCCESKRHDARFCLPFLSQVCTAITDPLFPADLVKASNLLLPPEYTGHRNAMLCKGG